MSNKSDPAWLKALKKEADSKGLSFRELLVKYDTKKLNTGKKKTKIVKAAKGGLAKKKK
tara:strand:+ start:1494 stop:1670 length:177 start_codon:yes stop_codon:yes gene_type:complete